MNFLPCDAEKAVLKLLEDLATPTSLGVAIRLRYGEYDQLAAMHVDPRHYNSAHSYWLDASAVSLLKKLPELPTSIDRKAVAEEAFVACELECLRTNRRLYPLIDGLLSSPYPDIVNSTFRRAREIVHAILGPCPDLVEGRFGPGTTFGDRGLYSTIPDKMSSEPTLTHDAWPFLVPWSGTLWASARASSCKSSIQFVRGNRFLTVPKDSTKDRGIAVEPSINVFYQLAYGRVIRDRLNRSGINLSEGQEIHRRLAREASKHGHLATLDLKNASDTICKNLVKFLLPPSWFSVLDDLRSKATLFKGSWRVLEKFSSMGNGFTFELETLLFLSLIAAVTGSDSIGRTVFVFGDDIILPTESAEDVISLLRFSGMSVNEKKSFVDGPFRESCGGDFFDGEAVRPFYLKESPNEPQQLISFANGLRRSCDSNFVRRHIVHRAWLSVLDGLPVNIRRLRGPEDLGDITIHDDRERWQTRWRDQIRYVRVYRPARLRRVGWQNFRTDVTLASRIYINSALVDKGVTPRGGVLGYKIGWVARS